MSLKGKTLICGLLLAAAGAGPAAAEERAADLEITAQMIAQKYLLIDTHIDVPFRLEEEWSDVTQRTEQGDFDYERALGGGLNIPFMSIYTPATEDESGSYALANRLIDRVEALAGRAPGKMTVVTSSREAGKAHERGLMGLAMGMENGSPIDGKLENVAFFKNRGIAYITLAHSLSNHLSDSSYDEERKWNGLSPFGKEVVGEMNRLGIMVDVSHLSDEAFWDVLEVSKVPVIASHSSARHFTPGWERNMSNEMIVALAEKGGVIQINFGSSFLTEEARQWYVGMGEARKAFLEQAGLDEHAIEAREFRDRYRAENPFPFATLDDVMAHFKHVINLVGVKHVGIGSDFDGVGDSLPEGMKDVSFYPALVGKFLEEEFSFADIEAIMGGNTLRVWRAAEDHAMQAASGG